jgi:RNA-directed DNA polymerase
MTFARIEEQGLEAWLAGLRVEQVSKTYRPDPVRRVTISKEWWRASARHSDHS